MGIALLPEHLALTDTVAAAIGKYAPIAATRSEFDDLRIGVWPACWAKLCDLGLLTLHLPEEAGGDDAGLLAWSSVLEQTGRGLLPGPFLPTVLTSTLIARHARAAIRDDLLGQFARGATGCTATVATGLTARLSSGGWIVDGTTEPILGALSAEIVTIAADTPERPVWLVLRQEQIELIVREAAEGVDLTRDIGRLTMHRLVVPADQELAATSAQIRALTGLAFAAEAVGLARWCQETGLEYVKVREQFGRPVGSFQAIQHKCARLFIQVETMTAAVWDAARAGEEDGDQFALAATAAAVTCVQPAVELALETITLLGGIGYTWEHDIHLYWRRAMSLAALLGPRSERQTALARLAESISRTTTVPLTDEPADLRRTVAAAITQAATEQEPQRRRTLAAAGLVAPHYPPPYGLGVGPAGQLVIAEEYAKAGLPQPTTRIGEWALPTLIAHGTQDQRDAFVAATLRGEIVWCQLFSEPGSGSDLASLTTRAEKVDGGWRLNGQKVWTSFAHEADVGMCLARTDPTAPKHQGIGYFLVDMHGPGVNVRPLREANGRYMFNEVFLDDVFVPDDRLVGEPDAGWTQARTTLGNERITMGRDQVAYPDLFALAGSSNEDPATVQRELGTLTARAIALQALGKRALFQRLSGSQPGAESSVLKLAAAWHHADVVETVLGWHGPGAAVTAGPGGAAALALLTAPQELIGGGTTEIQLNVIARTVLRLPRP